MLEPSAAVVLSGIGKAYAGRRCVRAVLADANLVVRRGEIVALTGPNGAGKSTVLRLIAGLLLPDAGQARVSDGGDGLVDPARRPGLVSAVFDGDRGLYWRLTVAENLRYLAGLDGIAPAEALLAAAPWLARFGLAGTFDELVQTLSKGMQQKVLLARVLARPRPVLLFDEPSVLLDDESVRTLAGALRDACAAGAAVVVATHDRDFLRLAGAREMRLTHDGAIVPALPSPSPAQAFVH